MWFWWFMLICDLLIPITMVVAGRMMWKHCPKHINGMFGYRTTRSCFYNNIVKKEFVEKNPLKVLESTYYDILNLKENPKEGSYTTSLFSKGIDEILKRLGEECTEIIIAAKNPDTEDIKFEISDFMYNCMVLMAEKGITWDEIAKELSQR